jgi:hypothetical protein
MKYESVVVLVPGFLGFGRLGNFYYFADRVAACLRGAAEDAFGKPTPVLGVATIPAGSLAERQQFLLRQLTVADRTLGRPARFHLVGHSAGGVDAELLRAESPLGTNPWSELDPEHVRSRLATITTIAAPHYGTYLADSGVVGLLRNPLEHLKAVPEASAVALQLAKLAVERPVIHEALVAGVQGWSDSARFLMSLLSDDKLLGEDSERETAGSEGARHVLGHRRSGQARRPRGQGAKTRRVLCMAREAHRTCPRQSAASGRSQSAGAPGVWRPGRAKSRSPAAVLRAENQ